MINCQIKAFRQDCSKGPGKKKSRIIPGLEEAWETEQELAFAE